METHYICGRLIMFPPNFTNFLSFPYTIRAGNQLKVSNLLGPINHRFATDQATAHLIWDPF